jgi:hypothetical protein
VRALTSIAVAAAALAAGCGGGSAVPSAPGPTRLVITVYPGFVANAHVTRYTLSCRPPGGSLPDPAAACGAIELDKGLLQTPVACHNMVPDVGSERITGVLDGRAVRVTLPGGCARWAKIRAALGLAPLG